MPIYEFVCPKCGKEIEIRATLDEKVACKCGCEMIRKISPPILIQIK